MTPERRLADAAEQVAQRAVAEEVDALAGEVELDLLRGGVCLAARPEHRLMTLRDLWCLLDVEVALVDHPLHDLVEQLRELLLDLGIALLVARGLPPQHLEHLGRELAGFHERLENGLLQGLQGPIVLVSELPPERMPGRAAGEARLQQEVAQLIQEILEVDRIREVGDVLPVRGEFHTRILQPAPRWGSWQLDGQNIDGQGETGRTETDGDCGIEQWVSARIR